MQSYCYVGSSEGEAVAQVSGFLFPSFVFKKKGKSVFEGTELPFVLDDKLPVFRLFKLMDGAELCCIEDAFAMSMFLQGAFEPSQPLRLSHSGALFLSSCSGFAKTIPSGFHGGGLIRFFTNRDTALANYTDAFMEMRRDVLNDLGASTSIANLVAEIWSNLFGTNLKLPQTDRSNSGSLWFAALIFTAIGNVPRDDFVVAQKVLDHPAVIKFFEDYTSSPEHAEIVFRCLLALARSWKVMC
jgi:hypothetical protein